MSHFSPVEAHHIHTYARHRHLFGGWMTVVIFSADTTQWHAASTFCLQGKQRVASTVFAFSWSHNVVLYAINLKESICQCVDGVMFQAVSALYTTAYIFSPCFAGDNISHPYAIAFNIKILERRIRLDALKIWYRICATDSPSKCNLWLEIIAYSFLSQRQLDFRQVDVVYLHVGFGHVELCITFVSAAFVFRHTSCALSSCTISFIRPVLFAVITMSSAKSK